MLFDLSDYSDSDGFEVDPCCFCNYWDWLLFACQNESGCPELEQNFCE